MTSTVTPDGTLVPTLTSAGKAAVKDLVTGVTGTVDDGHRQGVDQAPETPLDPVVEGLDRHRRRRHRRSCSRPTASRRRLASLCRRGPGPVGDLRVAGQEKTDLRFISSE